MLKTRSSISGALLVLSAFAFGCGDDDGGGDTETPTGDAGSGGSGSKTYTSTLVPITADDTSAPILIPHVVKLLDGDGKELVPPVSATTSSTDGKVTNTVPPTAKNIYVAGVGAVGGMQSTYDTMVVNHNWDSGDVLLRISSASTLSLAEMTGGYKAADDRAALSGAIYWTTDGKQRKGVVGCAKVYLDGATAPDEDQVQRYIGDTPLPAPLANFPQTTKVRGQFYFGNIKPGKHTLKASIDDGKTFIAEKEFTLPKTRAQAEGPTKSILYQIGLDSTAPANPTLASCVK